MVRGKMRAPFSAGLNSGGWLFEVYTESLVWLEKSRASQKSCPWYRRRRVDIFFFSCGIFPPYKKKRWALELGWNVIIGQHQTRELPIKVLGYKQHLFQMGLRLEELSFPLSLCLYHRSGTNHEVSLFSLCFSHLISLRLFSLSSFEFLYASCSLWSFSFKERDLFSGWRCGEAEHSIGMHTSSSIVQ